MRVTGGCHCGQITSEAEVNPETVRVCHCTDCQKLTGTPIFAAAPAPNPSTYGLRVGGIDQCAQLTPPARQIWSASWFQIHHDPVSPLQPNEAELPARSEWDRLCNGSHRGPRPRVKRSGPGCDDVPKARLPRSVPSRRCSECSDDASAKHPAPFNAHSRGGTKGGLAQHVFRSPARIQLSSFRGEACAPRRQAKNAVRYAALGPCRMDRLVGAVVGVGRRLSSVP
jgi:hypothetical protein